MAGRKFTLFLLYIGSVSAIEVNIAVNGGTTESAVRVAPGEILEFNCSVPSDYKCDLFEIGNDIRVLLLYGDKLVNRSGYMMPHNMSRYRIISINVTKHMHRKSYQCESWSNGDNHRYFSRGVYVIVDGMDCSDNAKSSPTPSPSPSIPPPIGPCSVTSEQTAPPSVSSAPNVQTTDPENSSSGARGLHRLYLLLSLIFFTFHYNYL